MNGSWDLGQSMISASFIDVMDVETKLKRYREILDKYPRDLQIVELGTNAHSSANEPGTSFNSRLFLADNDESRWDWLILWRQNILL